MHPTPLVSAPWLLEHLQGPKLRIVDVRYALGQAGFGLSRYREGHIPGALFLDLDHDLAAPVRPDRKGGRHPLPEPEVLAQTLGEKGIGNQHFVVAYDDSGMVAPRLWWMLRWLGHDAVAVLDGGLKAFVQAGGTLTLDEPTYPAARFVPDPRPEMQATAGEVAARRPGVALIDARASNRYAGHHETIDPVAGHIPGAINLNWAESIGADGRFKPAEAQQARFADLTEENIVYCGSGVSACANLLAMEVAGIKGAKLYVGSWSDWISDKGRPIATGDQP